MISLSHVGSMAHKSKTNSRSITKIGRRVPYDTCYNVHKFQGHMPTNEDTQNVPYLLNGKT